MRTPNRVMINGSDYRCNKNVINARDGNIAINAKDRNLNSNMNKSNTKNIFCDNGEIHITKRNVGRSGKNCCSNDLNSIKTVNNINRCFVKKRSNEMSSSGASFSSSETSDDDDGDTVSDPHDDIFVYEEQNNDNEVKKITRGIDSISLERKTTDVKSKISRSTINKIAKLDLKNGEVKSLRDAVISRLKTRPRQRLRQSSMESSSSSSDDSSSDDDDNYLNDGKLIARSPRRHKDDKTVRNTPYYKPSSNNQDTQNFGSLLLPNNVFHSTINHDGLKPLSIQTDSFDSGEIRQDRLAADQDVIDLLNSMEAEDWSLFDSGMESMQNLDDFILMPEIGLESEAQTTSPSTIINDSNNYSQQILVPNQNTTSENEMNFYCDNSPTVILSSSPDSAISVCDSPMSINANKSPIHLMNLSSIDSGTYNSDYVSSPQSDGNSPISNYIIKSPDYLMNQSSIDSFIHDSSSASPQIYGKSPVPNDNLKSPVYLTNPSSIDSVTYYSDFVTSPQSHENSPISNDMNKSPVYLTNQSSADNVTYNSNYVTSPQSNGNAPISTDINKSPVYLMNQSSIDIIDYNSGSTSPQSHGTSSKHTFANLHDYSLSSSDVYSPQVSQANTNISCGDNSSSSSSSNFIANFNCFNFKNKLTSKEILLSGGGILFDRSVNDETISNINKSQTCNNNILPNSACISPDDLKNLNITMNIGIAANCQNITSVGNKTREVVNIVKTNDINQQNLRLSKNKTNEVESGDIYHHTIRNKLQKIVNIPEDSKINRQNLLATKITTPLVVEPAKNTSRKVKNTCSNVNERNETSIKRTPGTVIDCGTATNKSNVDYLQIFRKPSENDSIGNDGFYEIIKSVEAEETTYRVHFALMLVKIAKMKKEDDRLNTSETDMVLVNYLFELSKVFGMDDVKKLTVEEKKKGEEIKRLWKIKLVALVHIILGFLKKPRIFTDPHSFGMYKLLTPLQVAALFNFKNPLIARCIADCVVHFQGDLNTKMYSLRGTETTLLQELHNLGYVNVIEELLKVTKNGLPVFTVNDIVEQEQPLPIITEDTPVDIILVSNGEVDVLSQAMLNAEIVI